MRNAATLLMPAVITRPLPPATIVGGAVAAVLLTATYCVLYSVLGGSRESPVDAAIWALVNIAPWWLALEAGKRVLSGTGARSSAWRRVGLILAATAVGSVLIERLFGAIGLGDPDLALGFQFVRRLPAAALVAALLAIGRLEAVRGASAQRSRPSDVAPDDLPPAVAIEWVRAAGNYVEVRAGGRTAVVRMTMREAERRLGRHGFVRVHRSMLVRADAVAAYLPGKEADELRLACGTSIRVGESYRSKVADRFHACL